MKKYIVLMLLIFNSFSNAQSSELKIDTLIKNELGEIKLDEILKIPAVGRNVLFSYITKFKGCDINKVFVSSKKGYITNGKDLYIVDKNKLFYIMKENITRKRTSFLLRNKLLDTLRLYLNIDRNGKIINNHFNQYYLLVDMDDNESEFKYYPYDDNEISDLYFNKFNFEKEEIDITLTKSSVENQLLVFESKNIKYILKLKEKSEIEIDGFNISVINFDKDNIEYIVSKKTNKFDSEPTKLNKDNQILNEINDKLTTSKNSLVTIATIAVINMLMFIGYVIYLVVN